MTIQEIKHEFLAFRNGIIADTLRKAGSPFEIIFGLQLPQIKEIAKAVGKDSELGKALWADRKVRESRILALAILPPESISLNEALEMAADIRTREEADLLPFLLLRFTPHIPALLQSLQSLSVTLQSSPSAISATQEGDSKVSPDGAISPLQSYLLETLSRFI